MWFIINACGVPIREASTQDWRRAGIHAHMGAPLSHARGALEGAPDAVRMMKRRAGRYLDDFLWLADRSPECDLAQRVIRAGDPLAGPVFKSG